MITVSTKSGFTLKVIEGDAITREIQSEGEYDSNTLDSLRAVLAVIKPRTSLDIGANVGNHAVVISQYSKQLLAFEPVKFIFDLLKENFELNHVAHARAVNVGLSDNAATRDIFVPQSGNLGCSTLEENAEKSVRLEITTAVGDSYLNESALEAVVDFIKIDVEGHEGPALLGFEQTILQQMPLILMEYKSAKTIADFTQHKLFERLFSGYKVYSLTYNHSKKVHAHNLFGFVRRNYHKWFDKKWCLSSFNKTKTYTNIYLVPPRYQSTFDQFDYLSATDGVK